jgi:hypothetical protein
MKVSYEGKLKKKREEKIFGGACAKCFIVMYISICAQHAKIYSPLKAKLCIHDRFEKGKKLFLNIIS